MSASSCEPPPPIDTDPLARARGFVAHLRLNDFRLGPADTALVADTLAAAGLDTSERARRRLKILLCANRTEWDAFDALFEAYWHHGGRARERVRPARAGGPGGVATRRLWQRHFGEDGANRERDAAAPPQVETDAAGESEEGGSGRLIASRTVLRGRVDLRHVVDPEEIRACERQAGQLARAMRYRLSRRAEIARRGRRPDLRRTIRASLSRGGEPFTLVRRATPPKPVRIVAFLDVSGSMEHYSRFYLQFLRGLVREWRDTDVYLVHTRLVRVTDVLREKDAMLAMKRLSLMAEGFGGGTFLGRSLGQFNRQHAKAALDSRSVVFVFSDGYDTGGSARLVEELARLKRRARRLVWLNPLLGWERYAPVNEAMRAAMPHLDAFMAANTLDSLARIEPVLERL